MTLFFFGSQYFGKDSTPAVLLAALVGVVTYAAAFRGSHALTPLASQTYVKAPLRKQLEWDARWPSILHSIVITTISAYLFLGTELFSDDQLEQPEKGPVILRHNLLSSAVEGYSLGYFTADLFYLVKYYPTLGGLEMACHHVAAWASVATSALGDEGHIYTLALLATECTTPFINMRWMLDFLHMRQSKAYLINGIMLVLDWLVFRILLFVPFFWHVYTHRHEFMLLSLAARVLLSLVPVLLVVLDVLWFHKIVRGAIKLLVKSRHAKDALLDEDMDSSLLGGSKQRLDLMNGSSKDKEQ